MTDPRCPQAWHGGLAYGLLHECRYSAGHRGTHRNVSGDLSWSGKLSDTEAAQAVMLRSMAPHHRKEPGNDHSRP